MSIKTANRHLTNFGRLDMIDFFFLFMDMAHKTNTLDAFILIHFGQNINRNEKKKIYVA